MLESRTTRRVFLKYGAATAAAFGLAGAGAWRASADVPGASLLRDHVSPCFDGSPVGPPFTQPLPIPPKLPPVAQGAGVDVYQLSERKGVAQIVPGVQTPIWGYNGITPGPTIMARKGREAQITFTNELQPQDEDTAYVNPNPPDPRTHPFIPGSTVVHLHGINADHPSDGYPEDRRQFGQSFTHHYPNNAYQRPATFWYHDHSVHITSDHVYGAWPASI
jgi:FtsP/CotA-like multicopper oxidase with cupredoxin domain